MYVCMYNIPSILIICHILLHLLHIFSFSFFPRFFLINFNNNNKNKKRNRVHSTRNRRWREQTNKRITSETQISFVPPSISHNIKKCIVLIVQLESGKRVSPFCSYNDAYH